MVRQKLSTPLHHAQLRLPYLCYNYHGKMLPLFFSCKNTKYSKEKKNYINEKECWAVDVSSVSKYVRTGLAIRYVGALFMYWMRMSFHTSTRLYFSFLVVIFNFARWLPFFRIDNFSKPCETIIMINEPQRRLFYDDA